MNAILKFPTHRIVRRRDFNAYLEEIGASEKRLAIETELRSLSDAVKALQRQRASVLSKLHHALKAEPALVGRPPECTPQEKRIAREQVRAILAKWDAEDAPPGGAA